MQLDGACRGGGGRRPRRDRGHSVFHRLVISESSNSRFFFVVRLFCGHWPSAKSFEFWLGRFSPWRAWANEWCRTDVQEAEQEASEHIYCM